MAFAASRKVNLGLALVRLMTTGSERLDVFFLPSHADLSRALKLSRGRPRRSAAMRSSGSIPASPFGALPSVRASIASRALSRCPIFFESSFPGFRERLGIGTLHARPQTVERAEL